MDEMTEKASDPRPVAASPAESGEVDPPDASAAGGEAVPKARDWFLMGGRALDLIIAGILMAVVVINHSLYYNDDAFITFRYAQNLAAWDGLVYHVGDPVLGTTAPAYAILLAILSWPLPDMLAAGYALGWIAFLVMGVGLYLIFEQLRRGAGFVGLLGLAFFSIDGAMKFQFGMESHLATGLGFLAVWAHLRTGRSWPLGVFMALMLLMRPDAVFLGAVIALSAVLRWRMPWMGIAVFLVIIGLWCAYSIPVYGSPVPHTVAAKYELGQSSSGEFAFVEELLGRYHIWYWHRNGLIWIGLLGLFAGAIAGFNAVLLILLWIVFHFLAFAISKIEAFDWYYIPIFAALYTGVCVWPFLVSRLINRHWFDLILRAGMLGGAVWLLITVRGWYPEERRPMDVPASPAARAYYDMAGWLRENAEPSNTIAATEIGVLGYYTGMEIIDLRGLVYPEALEHAAGRNFSWWNNLNPLPDYVVLHRPPWGIEGAVPRFMTANYRRVTAMGRVELFERSRFSFANMATATLEERRTAAMLENNAEMVEAIARHFTVENRRTQALETYVVLYQMRPPSEADFADLMTLMASIEREEIRDIWLRSLVNQAVRVGTSDHLRTLSEMLYLRGMYEESGVLVAREMELRPEDLEIRLRWGRVLWRGDRIPAAIDALQEITDHESMGIWATRLLAMIAEDQERWEDALALWEECLDTENEGLLREATDRVQSLRQRLNR